MFENLQKTTFSHGREIKAENIHISKAGTRNQKSFNPYKGTCFSSDPHQILIK